MKVVGGMMELGHVYCNVPRGSRSRDAARPFRKPLPFVNALGEVYLGKGQSGMPVAGTVDMTVLRERLGVRMLDDGDLEQELLFQLISAGLRHEEVAAVQKIWKLQTLTDDMMRVHGDAKRVVLCIEFAAFLAEINVWRALRVTACKYHYRWYVMDVHKEINRYSKDGGKTWITGPNHGKMRQQVEISRVIPLGITLQGLRRERALMAKRFEGMWLVAGVGVI